MLLERYSNIEYINNLDWLNGIELINKAFEKRDEQKDWDLWVSSYPYNDGKIYKSFKEFRGKKQVPKQSKKTLTKDEIIAQAEEIRLIHQGKHEGVKKN